MDRRQLLVATVAGSFALAIDRRGFAAGLGGGPVALVTADLESHVVVLYLPSAEVSARIKTAPGPRSIEVAHGLTAVVAHTEHGVVSILDAGGVRAELDAFEAPRYTAVHPDRRIAYVTDSASEQVVALNFDHGEVLWRTRVPGPARHISISPDGATIWTALGTKAARVAVLDSSDPQRPKLVRTFAPPFLGHDVAFAPDGRHIWVSSGSHRQIALYRADSRRPVRTLAADAPPQHVTFARGRAFVASGDDGTVRRHRLGGELVRAVRVPIGSYNVASGSGHVVTPSLDQGTVSLIDRDGRVRTVRVARAAHDACVVAGP